MEWWAQHQHQHQLQDAREVMHCSGLRVSRVVMESIRLVLAMARVHKLLRLVRLVRYSG
jgi:hypothetical protein